MVCRVITYAAKALKLLILDDALRPQVIVAGVPAIVCTSIHLWSKEILCLRELLGTLQTLTWDRQCLKSVLQTDVISNIIEFSQVSCSLSTTYIAVHLIFLAGGRSRSICACGCNSGKHSLLRRFIIATKYCDH